MKTSKSSVDFTLTAHVDVGKPHFKHSRAPHAASAPIFTVGADFSLFTLWHLF